MYKAIIIGEPYNSAENCHYMTVNKKLIQNLLEDEMCKKNLLCSYFMLHTPLFPNFVTTDFGFIHFFQPDLLQENKEKTLMYYIYNFYSLRNAL